MHETLSLLSDVAASCFSHSSLSSCYGHGSCAGVSRRCRIRDYGDGHNRGDVRRRRRGHAQVPPDGGEPALATAVGRSPSVGDRARCGDRPLSLHHLHLQMRRMRERADLAAGDRMAVRRVATCGTRACGGSRRPTRGRIHAPGSLGHWARGPSFFIL